MSFHVRMHLFLNAAMESEEAPWFCHTPAEGVASGRNKVLGISNCHVSVQVARQAQPLPRCRKCSLSNAGNVPLVSTAREREREPNVSSDCSSITTRQAEGKQSEPIRHIHAHASAQTRRGLAASKAAAGEERTRQAGWLKWDGCWLLEEPHSTRLPGLKR